MDLCGTCLLERGKQVPYCRECTGELPRTEPPPLLDALPDDLLVLFYLEHLDRSEAGGRIRKAHDMSIVDGTVN